MPAVLSLSVPPAASTAAAAARTGVGLLGCGVVGSAVARRLLAAHPGLLRAVAVRDPGKTRDVDWADFQGDPFAVVDDPAVGVVVECIGGVRLARELVLRAIARGKDVVTANKALIAQDGPWLRAFAARTGATLHYEAAVGGAIPILRCLETSLADEPIREAGGVVNGTTNFVLSQMEAGATYADALVQAQRRGFAEADRATTSRGSTRRTSSRSWRRPHFAVRSRSSGSRAAASRRSNRPTSPSRPRTAGA